jgi:hypothetical protein
MHLLDDDWSIECDENGEPIRFHELSLDGLLVMRDTYANAGLPLPIDLQDAMARKGLIVS